MQQWLLRHGPDNFSGSGLTNSEISETCANRTKCELFLRALFLCLSQRSVEVFGLA